MNSNEHSSLCLRKQIYSTLSRTPVLTIREISRQLNIPYSSLKYHLNMLEQQGAIQTKRDGKFLFYYSADSVGTQEKETLMVLRNTTARQIVLSLLLQGCASQIDLSRWLGKHPTTIACAVKKLVIFDMVMSVKASDVKESREAGCMVHPVRNERFFLLKNPASMSSVIQVYLDRFCTDDVSTSLVGQWMRREGMSGEDK